MTTNRIQRSVIAAVFGIFGAFGIFGIFSFYAAPAASADPAADTVCQLFAFGGSPDTVASSTVVSQVLGPDASTADKRMYIRSIVAGQCPQYLWRF